MKDWRRKPKRVVYPTGLTVDRYDLRNPVGSIAISVEVFRKPGAHCHIGHDSPGDVTVTGSVIPRGAKGLIRHESLPVRTFRARLHGPGGALREGMKLAWKWYNRLLPDAA